MKPEEASGQDIQDPVALSQMLMWNYHQVMLKTTEKKACATDVDGVKLL